MDRGPTTQWVRALIATAVVVAPVMVHGVVWVWYASSQPTWGFAWRFAPAFGVALAMWAVLGPDGATSRWVRASVLVPVVHVVVFALAWGLLQAFDTMARDAHWEPADYPLVFDVPWGAVTAALVAAVAVGAVALTAAPRGRARLPAVVSWVLVHFAIVGLLAPLLAAMQSGGFVRDPGSLAWKLYGASGVALMWVMFACRRGLSAETRQFALTLFGLVLAVAIAARLGSSSVQQAAYANVVPLLIVEAIVALAAIYALAFVHWRAVRRARRDVKRGGPLVLAGVVEAPLDQPVGWVEHTGWLTGLRLRTGALRVRTERGVVEVPANAGLVAPFPPASTRLEPGDALPVLWPGERVVVSGFDEPPGEGVFRTSTLPVGGKGLVVTTESAARGSASRDALHVVWRPCLLYLAAATAVVLPAVAALASR